MDFLRTLCESKLFPSQKSLEAKSNSQIADLTYRYILILRILLLEEDARKFAKGYVKKATEWGNFHKFHTNANDLYLLLHRLDEIDHPSKGKGHYTINLDQIHRWLAACGRGQDNEGTTRRIFLRLDADLKIHSQSMKALRRIVLDWNDQTTREKADTTEKLFKGLRHDAPRSEILAPLKEVMEEYQDERDEEINESLGTDVYNATILKEFDLSKSIDWFKKDNFEWRGEFTAGSEKYLVLLKMVTRSKPNAVGISLPLSGVDVGFARVMPDTDTSNMPDSELQSRVRDDNTGLAGTTARTVFSYVLAGTLQYIRERKPAFVMVRGEDEKKPTYRKIAKFLSPMMDREGYKGLRVVHDWITFWRTDLNVTDYKEG
jgi:hypothetical protein